VSTTFSALVAADALGPRATIVRNPIVTFSGVYRTAGRLSGGRDRPAPRLPHVPHSGPIEESTLFFRRHPAHGTALSILRIRLRGEMAQ